MATAEKHDVPPVKPDYSVTLTLSSTEAELLRGLVGFATFNSDGEDWVSNTETARAIFDAIEEAGVPRVKKFKVFTVNNRKNGW